MGKVKDNTEIQGLTHFHVRGFKSIYNASIEPGYLNVIIGANGAGKSNLLEALGVMGSAVYGSIDQDTLERRGVRLGKPAIYKSAFKSEKLRPFITLEAKWKENETDVCYRIGMGNPLKQPQKRWYYKTESLEINGKPKVTRSPRSGAIFGEKKELDPFKGLVALARVDKDFSEQASAFLNALEDYVIYMPTTPVLRGVQQDGLGIYGGNLPAAVLEIIRMHHNRQIDLNIVFPLIDWMETFSSGIAPDITKPPDNSVSKRTVTFTDKYMRKGRNILTSYDASEGALFVLFLLSAIYSKKMPRMFAIDNFDSGINPRLLKDIVGIVSNILIKKNTEGKQVFLTCHNPLVLDGLPLYDDRIRLFALDRDKKGRTTITRIEVDESLYKDNDVPLSTLWTMGAIGGVPKGF